MEKGDEVNTMWRFRNTKEVIAQEQTLSIADPNKSDPDSRFCYWYLIVYTRILNTANRKIAVAVNC